MTLRPFGDASSSPSPDLLISHLYFFAEHFNAYLAGLVRKDSSALPPLQSIVLDVRKYLVNPSSSWSDRSELLREATRLGLTPQIMPSIIDDIARHLLAPAEIEVDDRTGNWKLVGRPFLPSPNVPDELWEDLWFYEIDKLVDVATLDLWPWTPEALMTAKDQRSLFWEELLNPLLFAQGFLIERENIRSEEAANHLIQRWIRRHFGIPFESGMKYALSDICKLSADMFFASGRARAMQDLRRTNTIGTLTFFKVLSRRLASLLSLEEEISSRRAVGVYVALRFSRVLRVRYQWFDEKDSLRAGEGSNVPAPYTMRQCLSALGPIEYSFIVTRLFGSISNISGLNFIFRGGILPRNSSGRSMVVIGEAGAGKTVFALQKLSGIAARGGLAVYMSFEETRELLIDRLVMFDLMKEGDFELPESEQEFQELAASIRKGESPPVGALYLYGTEEGRLYDVSKHLRRIEEGTKDVWRWRAVVLDSVNALELHDRPFSRMLLSNIGRSRVHLRDLIQNIESSGYLGLFLTEPGARWLTSLPFLADTVLELGLDEASRTRWIDIHKCRSQNFHAGRHSLRIAGGEGLKVYPSLAALRSSLRKKVVSGLSSKRRIYLPLGLGRVVKFDLVDSRWISEKGSNLILGPPSSGKSLLALATALSQARSISGVGVRGKGEMPNLLMVTFRTPETKVQQVIAQYPELKSYFDDGRVTIKWFAPGDNISAEQFVFAVRKLVKDSRRKGRPIDRVIFDEVESAEYMLPHIDREPLFWTTILQFLGSEALTSFFVLETGQAESRALKELRAGVDYIFRNQEMARGEEVIFRVQREKLPDSEL